MQAMYYIFVQCSLLMVFSYKVAVNFKHDAVNYIFSF